MGIVTDAYRERLRTVMLLRGLSDAEELAKLWGLSPGRVAHLLENPRDMLALEQQSFRAKLGVRGGWLFTGHGAMLPATDMPGVLELLVVLDSLSLEKRTELLRIARRMALET